MHLLGICVLLVFLLFTNLASDLSRSDDYYYDYDSEQERTDEPLRVSTGEPGCVGPTGPTSAPLGAPVTRKIAKRVQTIGLSTLLRWG